VLLPVRNADPFLRQALACLRAQQRVRLQVVAVDDGSTDDSPAILREEAAGWPALEVLTGPAAGVPAALERARATASAPWIGRMDADDTCPPQRFRALLDHAAEDAPDADVVGSRIEAFGDEPVSRSMMDYLDWQNSLLDHDDIVRNRFVESPLAHATAVIRAPALHRVGGWDTGVTWSEDVDLWCRLAEAGARFSKVEQVLYRWRMHDTQATRVDPRCSAAQMRACKVHYLARGPLAGRQVELWSVGRTLDTWTADLTAAGCEVHPRRVRPAAARGAGALFADEPGRVVLAVYGAMSARQRIASAWTGATDGLWFAA
jgi:hypothetical protein